ncbi:MAG: esterase/lipase family protein [Pseudonocardiaceae bacterium]
MCAGGCGGSRRRRGLAVRVVLATLALLAATAVFSPALGRADTRYPVLLVHGGIGSPADFRQMIDWLKSDGYRPYTVDLGFPGIDTAANAKKIGTKADQIRAETGASKVHLVGHSMGGLSARYYIKILGGLPHVASYTAFGTPQHGNPSGCFLVPDQCPDGPILQRLNRGDDTPGRIHYTSIASKQAHAEEANGRWHPLDRRACLPLIDGGPHDAEPRNAVIYQAVKDGLNSACPPEWRTNLPEIRP